MNVKKSVLIHASSMLFRNRRNYFMLAITIILSFSILLGYIAVNDSLCYNRYKAVFSSSPKVLVLETQTNSDRLNRIVSTLKKRDDSIKSYTYFEQFTSFPQYGNSVGAKIKFLPESASSIVVHEFAEDGLGEMTNVIDWVHEIEIVKGSTSISNNSAIVNESFYNSVLNGADLPVSLIVPMRLSDGKTHSICLRISGVCADTTFNSVKKGDSGDLIVDGTLYCSQSTISGVPINELITPNYVAVVSTDKPERIINEARKIDVVVHSAYEAREVANEQMRSSTNMKMWIAIVLYIILGINLFGCFENALEKRKFEIGVKRAIGASDFRIILQFLVEGIIVMVFSIIISIVIVLGALALFKSYMLWSREIVWTIYISSSSIYMFLVCGISMTILYSLIFAYRATRVEIVKYLKGE